MNDETLEKIEMAHCWLGLQRGQKSHIITLLNNWAICNEMLEQIIGEAYEIKWGKK